MEELSFISIVYFSAKKGAIRRHFLMAQWLQKINTYYMQMCLCISRLQTRIPNLLNSIFSFNILKFRKRGRERTWRRETEIEDERREGGEILGELRKNNPMPQWHFHVVSQLISPPHICVVPATKCQARTNCFFCPMHWTDITLGYQIA